VFSTSAGITVGIYDAVVLAGGLAKRLGGLDKPSLDVAGKSMLERALAASSTARSIVVVGVPRLTARSVTWTSEDPPHGGPLAGVGAGLAALPSPAAEHVVVLACDMPYLTSDDVDRLLAELPGHEAAVFVDEDDVAQPLAGAYLTTALAASLESLGDLQGRPARRMLTDLHTVKVADRGATRDCDTEDQLEAARIELLRRKAEP
jgi:molybdopterin-guanine dinucleotide biosynthesis protein A